MKIDFSQKAVQAAVKKAILQHPVTTYCLIGGIIGLFLFKELITSPLLMGLSLAAVIFGAVLLAINWFLRRKSFENRYLARLNRFLLTQQQQVMRRLKSELKAMADIRELRVFAKQATEQYGMVGAKFENFKKILAEKFDAGELTHARFLGTAEQLYLSVLDNLEAVLNFLETIKNIDDKYIEERLKYLHSLSRPEPADEREIKTLGVRREVKQKQLTRVNDLLTINEEAMTQIDLSMAEISAIKTRSDHASMDMEIARKELEELIRRIKQYSGEQQPRQEKPVLTSQEQEPEVARSRQRSNETGDLL